VADDADTSLMDLVGVAAQMIADAGIAESRAIGSADQLDRRTYVRTVFALVEGVSFCRRNHAENDSLLSEARRDRARKAAAAAWAAGQHVGEKMKACLRVRAGFAAVAAAHEIANPLGTDGGDWQHFKDALEVRNRITHQKTLADCTVGDEDVALVREVHAWYQRLDTELMATMSPASKNAGPAG